MGIFKDFATSGYGDFTVGALSGLAEQGRLDYEKNLVFATDSLNKENAAFKETELAFKNKKEITGILSFQVIKLLHFGQNDLPDTTPFSRGRR